MPKDDFVVAVFFPVRKPSYAGTCGRSLARSLVGIVERLILEVKEAAFPGDNARLIRVLAKQRCGVVACDGVFVDHMPAASVRNDVRVTKALIVVADVEMDVDTMCKESGSYLVECVPFR